MNEMLLLLLLRCAAVGCVVDRLGGDVHARDRDGCDNVVWSRLGLDDRRVLGHFDRSRLIFQHKFKIYQFDDKNCDTDIRASRSCSHRMKITA